MSNSRWIDLVDMVNVRDIGGLPTVDGRTTRSRVLLRGETPDLLDPRDVAVLVDEIGLRAVVDLRMPNENAGQPSPLADRGVNMVALPMWENPMTSSVLRDRFGPEGGHQAFGEFYLLALDGFGPRAIAMLELIVSTDGPVMIHCTGGKDRTGIATTLLLGAVGVEIPAIVADYAATGERLEELYARVGRLTGVADPTKGIPAHAQGAAPATIQHVIDTLTERHGSLRQWWIDAGAAPELLEQWELQILGRPLGRRARRIRRGHRFDPCR